ncbi:MAG: response regulator [Anaerolineae bacterium]|nr:response regulator [Anaerolineae bacterium]
MSEKGLPPQQSLRVLLIEDLNEDAKLVEREIKKVVPDYELQIVKNQNDLEEALDQFEPDLILSDYLLPGFRGSRALEIVQTRTPYTPFVFVTGTIDDEEMAAQAILDGACGFLLKRNLWRLPDIVNQALEVASKRSEEQQQVRHLEDTVAQQKKALAQYEKELDAVHQQLEALRASQDA